MGYRARDNRAASPLPRGTMTLFASVALLAVGLGYALGGRLRRFERLRLRWWWLAGVGLALQFLPQPEGPDGRDLVIRTAVLSVSYVMLLTFAFANLHLPGLPLILIGLACNFTVIAANGGMPVSQEALLDSGQADVLDVLRADGSQKHHLMGEDDVLTFLADVIPIQQPIGQAISAGDIFVYAGLIVLAVATMRGRIPSRNPTTWGAYRGKHRPGSAEQEPSPVTWDPRETLPGATRSGSGQ